MFRAATASVEVEQKIAIGILICTYITRLQEHYLTFSNRLSSPWLIVARLRIVDGLLLFGMRHSTDNRSVTSAPNRVFGRINSFSAQTQSEIHYCSHLIPSWPSKLIIM